MTIFCHLCIFRKSFRIVSLSCDEKNASLFSASHYYEPNENKRRIRFNVSRFRSRRNCAKILIGMYRFLPFLSLWTDNPIYAREVDGGEWKILSLSMIATGVEEEESVPKIPWSDFPRSGRKSISYTAWANNRWK